jgi:exo-beta-1,3-glucanase (GH17 family)
VVAAWRHPSDPLKTGSFLNSEGNGYVSKSYLDYFPVNSGSSSLASRSDALASAFSKLAVTELPAVPLADRQRLFSQVLENRLHGLSFSPYQQGQAPGIEISEAQILERLRLIAPYCQWIRTFSCTEGNQRTPKIARELGLKVMVGVGLGEDRERNDIELANGLQVAAAGLADILAVGNEVLLRGDLSEDELLDYIARAKEAVPGVPVGYVDAYFLFEKHPRLVEACDVILINCYPFWEHCPIDYAVAYMKEMYRRAVAVAGGKKVIISETGWPSQGDAFGDSLPGYENSLNYFLEAVSWADENGVEMFYFSSFDESWKVGDEGGVGAYWGLWDEDGHLKFGREAGGSDETAG